MESPDSPATPLTPPTPDTPKTPRAQDDLYFNRPASPFHQQVLMDDEVEEVEEEKKQNIKNVETKNSTGKFDPFFHFDSDYKYYNHPQVPEINEYKKRNLFDSYFKRYSFMRHHLESFDLLMDQIFPQIIEENNFIEVISKKYCVKHVVKLENMTICKPMFREHDGTVHNLKVNDGSARKFTYSAAILIDLIHEIYERQYIPTEIPPVDPKDEKFVETLKERRVYKEFTLFHMPIMVGTEYCHARDQVKDVACPYVPGGYFIVNGNEKAIIPREKLRTNHLFVTKESDGSFTCEFRSWNEKKIRSTSTLYMYLQRQRGETLPQLYVEIPFIDFKIPLPHVFRILNITDPQKMRKYILLNQNSDTDHPYDHYIRSILKDDKTDFSREDLMDFIGKKGTADPTREKRVRSIENIFFTEFFPHVGLERTPEIIHNKLIHFGYAIFDFLRRYNGDAPLDDRDDYSNKRLETVHMLCALQFRQLLRNFRKTFTTAIHKAIENEKFIYILDMMKNSKRITAGFKYALSTGKWGMSKGASTQTGVAQVLMRMNVLSTISHLRRINTPINRDGKMTQPRQLHLSSWGLVDPAESPEGPPCGLIKNLALLCHVRLGYPSSAIERTILNRGVNNMCGNNFVTPLNLADDVQFRVGDWVFINGKIIGIVDFEKRMEFVDWLRKQRREQIIPFDASIVHYIDKREIHVYVDAGCMCRPVFVLENLYKFDKVYRDYCGHSDLLWDMMISNGIIEYIDKCEEFTLRIAVTPGDLKIPRREDEMPFTHIEIHPNVIMGLAVSTLPFCPHDQAPRVTYGSVMSKQGLGLVGLNYKSRYDTGGTHMLWYPQKPLVTTFMNRVSGLDDIPFTINCIVAIGAYTGFNQEDSIIMNKSSVDRGLFRSYYFKTFKETAKNVGADQEVFEKPDVKSVTGIKKGNYEKINADDAIVDLEEEIEANDILIGKVMRSIDQNKRVDEDKVHKDRSVMYNSKEKTRVDKVSFTQTKDGALMVNVRTRAHRIPRMGDKFASKKGQKGVCSILLPPEDMPFTRDGIIPDLIINTNALPSRMTLSQILETVLGKTAALSGEIGDGTAWGGITADMISDELFKFGFERNGNECMHNGMTGEKMECSIFIGPCPYMRLKHMVADKIHARRTGPRQIVTRQPVEGRSRKGGLRFGEMERDMLLSHEVFAVIRDRLMKNSDYYETVVCKKCKLLAQLAPPTATHVTELMGKDNKPFCQMCKSSEHIRKIALPAAFKVLMQILEACHIRMKMEIEEDD